MDPKEQSRIYEQIHDILQDALSQNNPQGEDKNVESVIGYIEDWLLEDMIASAVEYIAEGGTL